MTHSRGAGGSVELDVRYYREEPKPLPKNVNIRFIPEKRETMFYGYTVDLNSVKNLGALTSIWRDTFVTIRASTESGYWKPNIVREVQYTVEYAVPEQMSVNLGKVRLLPSWETNAEFPL